MHTGITGFGYKVDKKTIIQFMKKYNAKESHLLELLKNWFINEIFYYGNIIKVLNDNHYYKYNIVYYLKT